MTDGNLVSVILCGGQGTRLWPLSRKSLPKQFTRLTGEETLYQTTLKRLANSGASRHMVLTSADTFFFARQQAAPLQLEIDAFFVEPESRNTAPAVLAAALHILERDPEALLLVSPSDHLIADEQAFRDAVMVAAEEAQQQRIVTFGIVPDRPETGYGYLELCEPPIEGRAQPLERFVEKPSLDRAKEMLADGNYLWNAGIFLFRADVIVQAYESLAPHLVPPVKRALEYAQSNGEALKLDKEAWSQAENISIDYAIMEKASNLSVVPVNCGWSDLGDWDAVARAMPKDGDGNVLSDGAIALTSRNTLLRSDDPHVQLVGIGLDDMIAVATQDAVLVAPRSQAQEVKKAVEILRQKGARQATEFPHDHRPWGWYECVCKGDKFQVKRIVVKPGGILSLQSHRHRAEHWIVVEGQAKVTIGDETRLLKANESVYVPVGEKHRLENPGDKPVVIIEVQTGNYLGEDDIIRYEDVYGRL